VTKISSTRNSSNSKLDLKLDSTKFETALGKHLFNGVKRSKTSRKILRIVHVAKPRSVSEIGARGIIREESKVAVCHVVVLGAEQEASHDREFGVTVHDHCKTHIAQRINAKLARLSDFYASATDTYVY